LLWVGGGTIALLLLALAPLTALLLRTDPAVDATRAARGASVINVPPPSAERLVPAPNGSSVGTSVGTSGGTSAGTSASGAHYSNGDQLSAIVQSDGTADVTETLTLSPQTHDLVLAVPASATPPGSKPSAPDAPQALSVTATSNGQIISPPLDVGVSPVTVALPAGTNHVVLHYLLVGSTVRSQPSAAGRALTAIAPIAARSQPGLGLTINLRGSDADIRNLVCPAQGRDGAICAAQTDGRWSTTTELAAATSFGLAQVDLPQ
jgi:hypothetical protein